MNKPKYCKERNNKIISLYEGKKIEKLQYHEESVWQTDHKCRRVHDNEREGPVFSPQLVTIHPSL